MENKIALLSLLTFYFLYVETQERGISVLEQERCVLQKVVANDCSRRVMCRMDGEGAVKRERLVTDTVSRREVQ